MNDNPSSFGSKLELIKASDIKPKQVRWFSNVLIDHMQDAAAEEAGRQGKRNRERIAGEAR